MRKWELGEGWLCWEHSLASANVLQRSEACRWRGCLAPACMQEMARRGRRSGSSTRPAPEEPKAPDASCQRATWHRLRCVTKMQATMAARGSTGPGRGSRRDGYGARARGCPDGRCEQGEAWQPRRWHCVRTTRCAPPCRAEVRCCSARNVRRACDRSVLECDRARRGWPGPALLSADEDDQRARVEGHAMVPVARDGGLGMEGVERRGRHRHAKGIVDQGGGDVWCCCASRAARASGSYRGRRKRGSRPESGARHGK